MATKKGGDWDYQFRDKPAEYPDNAVVIEWEPGVIMTWTGIVETKWADS